MPIISVKNLTVNYGAAAVLKNISFEVETGDFIVLTGSNGAGKTTLVRALIGLIPVNSGSIELFGEKIQNFRDWQKIGYLPQTRSELNLLAPATVSEIVSLGLLAQKKFPRRFTKNDSQAVAKIMQLLNISPLADLLFSELSGGQQQKVILARVLILNPKLLIFDEPTNAFDLESRIAFFSLLDDLNKNQKATIIFITHYASEARKYANKIFHLDKEIIKITAIK